MTVPSTNTRLKETATSIHEPDFNVSVNLCGKPFHVVNWKALKGFESFVCLHGGVQNAWSLPAMLLPFLRNRGSVLSFQIPGFNDDVGPEALRHQYTWSPSLTDEVSEVLKFGDVEDGVFIGFSYGALLATMYAARFPDRVRKLILVDLIPHRTEEQFARILDISRETVARRETMVRVLKLTDFLPHATEDSLLNGVVRDPAIEESNCEVADQATSGLDEKRRKENQHKCRFKITDFAIQATLPSTISRVWPYSRSIDTTRTEVLVLHAPFAKGQVGEEPLHRFLRDDRTGKQRPNMTAVEIPGTDHKSILSTGRLASIEAIEKFLDGKSK